MPTTPKSWMYLQSRRFLPINNHGEIQNPTNKKLIKKPWKGAVDYLVRRCNDYLADEIHSIYLAGSVAQGIARKNFSDIDFRIVVNHNPKKMDLNWIPLLKKEAKEKFPFSYKLDLSLIWKKELLELNNPHFDKIRFMIKVCGQCVDGKNIQPLIPPFHVTPATGYHINMDAGIGIDRAIDEIKKSHSAKNTRFWCQDAMRRILRAGFACSLEGERLYTYELYPCYTVFAKHYPEKEKQMRQAVKWAINPTANKKKLLKYLQTFGVWIKLQLKKGITKTNSS